MLAYLEVHFTVINATYSQVIAYKTADMKKKQMKAST